MVRAYAFLAAAIGSEVVATLALKASRGFSRPGPSVLVVLGYALAFFCLSKSLEAGMGLGAAYAIWSGAGIVLIATLGFLVFGERFDLAGIVGIGLILVGVLVLNVFSTAARHG